MKIPESIRIGGTEYAVKYVPIHEILHGILEAASFNIDEETEEKVVDVLSKGLYQVLQDNGKRLFDIKD